MIAEPPPIIQVFQDMSSFAWDLLDHEIRVDSLGNIDGKEIAGLLSLYMRAIERLNSLQDKRENYFKNKVTALMMRPSVIKALNKPKQEKQEKKEPVSEAPKTPVVEQFDLEQRKKEMQMRMTYQKQQHNQEALSKMITQHNQRANNIDSCITQVISENQQRIQDRIKQRKSRNSTIRDRSVQPLQQARQEDKKIYVVGIQVIKEENEQGNVKLTKRKYSFDHPKATESEVQEPLSPNGKKKERRKSFFQIHLKLKEY